QGTAFADGPATLAPNYGLSVWTRASLPPWSTIPYSAGELPQVSIIPHRAGKIVGLAWNWEDAAPEGSQDGGWNEVLRRAVLAPPGAPVYVQYVDAASPDPIAPYLEWEQAARTIQEAIDAAWPGATIWVTNGTYATGSVAGYPAGSHLPNRVAVRQAVT